MFMIASFSVRFSLYLQVQDDGPLCVDVRRNIEIFDQGNQNVFDIKMFHNDIIDIFHDM